MKIGLAIRAFFAVLTGSADANQVQALLTGPPAAAGDHPPETPPDKSRGNKSPPSKEGAPSQHPAITLLAALQREARLVDLIQEPLAEYNDDQIGAAARDVLRDCKQTLDRMFGLKSIVDAEEESEVETPTNASPERFRLLGNPSGSPPYRGKLVHAGWEASRCEIPKWSGEEEARNIIAPVEVDVA